MSMMTSSRPYLLRAIREWIQDNGLTPYILVQASYPGTLVPEAFINDDRIVLNLSSQATAAYQLDNDWLLFEARFSGRSMNVQVPIAAILAIYARENGEGMVFENTEVTPAASPEPTNEMKTTDDKREPAAPPSATDERPPSTSDKKTTGKRPHLELIKR